MTENLRLNRKKIVTLLEEQQRADALAAKRIQTIVLDANRRVMTALADLLDQLTSSSDLEVISLVSPQFDSKRWLLQLKKRSELKAMQRKETVEADIAARAYTDHSPLGFMSRWGQDDQSKQESKRLKAIQESKAAQLLSTGRILEALEAQMEAAAEQFLRKAMTNRSLDILSASPSSVQKEISMLLEDSKAALNEVWRKHLSTQDSSLNEAIKLLENMRQHYPAIKGRANGSLLRASS